MNRQKNKTYKNDSQNFCRSNDDISVDRFVIFWCEKRRVKNWKIGSRNIWYDQAYFRSSTFSLNQSISETRKCGWITEIVFFDLLLHIRHARVANLHVLLVTLLPGSVGLSLHLPRGPEPYSSCRSYFRQKVLQWEKFPKNCHYRGF